MRYYSPAELEKVTTEAFQMRLDGNEKLKSGDLQGALVQYHQVLLRLKGLEPSFKSTPAPVIAPATEGQGPSASDKPETLDFKVKEAIKLTYLNSAIIHIKKKNFKRALECAQTVLQKDEKNPKARFREAQARIGLGEVNKGKQLLQELQKETKDPAVAAALKELEQAEKANAAKTDAHWKGMFTKSAAKDESKAQKQPESKPTAAGSS
ncbi:hypothetical protein ACM66B_000829 [Microbotryomycetes sp. NB124-2]